ncbi:MAG: bifunctional precorrin-2 dehydrogenase/sirohydrochlorin ferrochelatase [Deltaproteobacteria bacterium]|nr:bifunctional precorrin-2 dehydrogenase/sirohydrochlorin ferrochelatase [Deltaproteobacteria bacterium]MBW2065448.1 bifunctional precorrin-2 dehydrogenase/sirohydrochlorin ferrochelatase [Deltaproteobacteria bacterium]
MAYYPVLIDLSGKEVLVVGGGQVAERKIDSLLEAGAAVKVVAEGLSRRLQEYVDTGKITYLGPKFQENHLQSPLMVFSATSDRHLNSFVSRCAREKGLLVNAVDQPSDCSFILPAVFRRGDLLICVSTSGRSPALARRIREELERKFGREYEIFLILMGVLRQDVLSRGLNQEQNRGIFYELVNSPLLECLAAGQWERAASLIKDATGIEWSGEDILKIVRRAEDSEKEA